MQPNRVRTWRAWLFETFGRGGYFSLRPLPLSDAERQQQQAESQPPPADMTRLNIDPEPTKRSH
jgi:hypothetical protein